MNRIYRIVWNHSLKCAQVASEMVSSTPRSGGSRQGQRCIHLNVLGLAMALALPFTAWAAAYEGHVLPDEDVYGRDTPARMAYDALGLYMPIGGDEKGEDAVLVEVDPDETPLQNVSTENWQAIGGRGEDHYPLNGVVRNGRAGDGGAGLIFRNPDKDRNLTLSTGSLVRGGDGGYARGSSRPTYSEAIYADPNAWGWDLQGEDSFGGQGGSNTITANDVTNPGQILGGQGGDTEAGNGKGFGGYLYSGNGIGAIGNGGHGGDSVFDTHSLLNDAGARIDGGDGGQGTGGVGHGGATAHGTLEPNPDHDNPGVYGPGVGAGGNGIGGDGGSISIDSDLAINQSGSMMTGGDGGAGRGGNGEAGRAITSSGVFIASGTGVGGDGYGGTGGDVAFAGGNLINDKSTILGGNGGDGYGGDGYSSGPRERTPANWGVGGTGFGGDGGGLFFDGLELTNSATSLILGGMGGTGYAGSGQQTDGHAGSAGGGLGGAAVSLDSTEATALNEGQMIGGKGGDAVADYYEFVDGSVHFLGGTGGDGMAITGNGNSVDNARNALISGGDYGRFVGTRSDFGDRAQDGYAGRGLYITGNDNTIRNYGTIAAGEGREGYDILALNPEPGAVSHQLGSAIVVEGNGNTLVMQQGSTVDGSVTIFGQQNTFTVIGQNRFNGDFVFWRHNYLGWYGRIIVDGIVYLEDTGLDLNGVSSVGGTEDVLSAAGGISGNFGDVTVAGMELDATDFMSAVAVSSPDARTINIDYELSWANSDTSAAHGNFTLADAEGSFIVGAALGTQTGNDHWDGNSLTKMGEGQLVLDGINTYTGLTDVQAGKLVVGHTSDNNDAQVAGNVDVHSGAALGGHGRILGHVNLLDGARLTPGNSIGTLTVDSITFESGSVYEFEAHPDGSADKVNVVTHATLNGSQVAVIAGNGVWAASTPYTLLTAGTSVTGTFDNVTSNLAFLTPELSYEPNNVYLTLSRNDIAFDDPEVAVTYNQRSTAAAIEALGTADAVYAAIVGLDTSTARAAYDNLSGEIHASVRGALFQNSRFLRDAITQRLVRAGGEDLTVQGVRGWVSGWGHHAETKSNGNAAKTKNDGSGFIIGGDLALGDNARIGAALGYEYNKTKLDHRNSSAETDALHVALYGGVDVGPLELKAGVAYSDMDVKTERNIWVPGLESQNTAQYDARVTQAFVETGHTFWMGSSASLTPYLGVAHVHVKTDSAEENVTESALRVRGESEDVTYMTLGLRSQLQLMPTLRLYGDLGWQHAFGDTDPTVRHRFLGATGEFDVRGVPLAENSVAIGAGVNWKLSEKSHLRLGYQGQLGDKLAEHSAHIRFDYRF